TRMVVTSQPTSQRVNPGTPVTFTLGLSNGLAPYVYQWKLNGTDVANGTASSLTLNNAQVADAGTYTVSITDSLGQVITSQPAVLIVAPLGTGVGLTADYYNVPAFSTAAPANPFAGNPALSRVDPTVDFDWGTTGSPDLSYVTADYFTARWHGQVQPFYSQVHTFYTRTDDGVRLWVNGQLLVNQWVAQAPTEHSGTIALNAGNKYDLVMEYYEKASGAVAQLSWSTPSLPKAIISTTQLYTNSGPFRANLTSSLLNGTNVILNWMGTCTVESATNITGPWTPLATDIAGPYTNSIGSEPEMYFRLLSQQSL
ncbi:MAG TPA: PA14 domain-containing protein, partial [Candidatus Sulfotelmatobacter sp.]|nr:PA14 domain-containing protein [Candidatus Sulfotelmatobacter sp.]